MRPSKAILMRKSAYWVVVISFSCHIKNELLSTVLATRLDAKHYLMKRMETKYSKNLVLFW